MSCPSIRVMLCHVMSCHTAWLPDFIPSLPSVCNRTCTVHTIIYILLNPPSIWQKVLIYRYLRLERFCICGLLTSSVKMGTLSLKIAFPFTPDLLYLILRWRKIKQDCDVMFKDDDRYFNLHSVLLHRENAHFVFTSTVLCQIMTIVST